ncbi:MAG: Sec-independent protein translocase protein TatB [Ilumatobacteraceae bacterium]
MFNIQGSELIFLLLVALVVLGPEKLPEAVRKFTKTYAEFKKMANGFQGEFRQAFDEPMRELRDTANLVRDAAKFDLDLDGETTTPAEKADVKTDAANTTGTPGVSEITPRTGPSVRREAGLNFGSANPRRQTRIARTDDDTATTPLTAEAPASDAATTPAAEATAEDATE